MIEGKKFRDNDDDQDRIITVLSENEEEGTIEVCRDGFNSYWMPRESLDLYYTAIETKED